MIELCLLCKVDTREYVIVLLSYGISRKDR